MSVVKRAYLVGNALVLLAVLALAVHTNRAQDWHPIPLFVLIFVLVAVSERMTVTIGSRQLSAAFIPTVLAMSLLGPTPATVIGTVVAILDALIRKISFKASLNLVFTYASFYMAGGLLVRAIVGDVHNSHVLGGFGDTTFGLVVFGVFLATNVLNFALVGTYYSLFAGRPLMRQVRDLFMPLLPSQVAAAGLAAVLAVVYTRLGYTALLGLVVVLGIFQYLAVALLRSEDRAEQIEARSIRLASLQLGVLVTLVETLALRDRVTARHAAAVARYARKLARELDCDEAEQDLAHTAGLLHDIGKFALPDRILQAQILSDDDWALIRRHPQEGATLVGRLDGYGPVADAILYHHEHVDGSGYPAGLIGKEIPLTSRIIAICSTYDTLTARNSYRSPMTPQDAITELRRVSGRQLDEELVHAFIAMLERDGPVTHAGGEDADFEEELAFERRARVFAQPTSK
jgi:putative nucleotidyltransferase with HDIG domain